MKYLVILLTAVILSGWTGCVKRYQAISPDQTRINAYNLCRSAGFKPNTDSHSQCVMSEMQRQLNAQQIEAENRKARAGQALLNLRKPITTTNCRNNFGTLTCTTY